MSKKFFTDIKNIRTAIDTKKLVVFAGAGISVDAGIPGWKVLIDEMKSEIEIPKYEDDYLRIAQMYFNDRQQKDFVDKARSVLKHKKIKHNEIHEEIFQLNPEYILTTNYDDLLEQVIKKKSLPFSVVSKDKQFTYALNTNLLVKIHGDLDDTDIVLKEDDYIDYSYNHPLIEAFIKSIFASKVVLFVGYGFSDINLKMIIQSVRNILGGDFQNAYLLSIDEDFHPTQREYLRNKGINVVNYFDAFNSAGVNYITDYLSGNNALKEVHFKKIQNLSDKGQNLYNFLKFISNYDKFNEPLTEKNVIDQIFLSLNRFSELKSLPPDFVANLYPFNDSEKYVHNYQSFSLLTRNHKLYDLFFEQIEYVDSKVKFKPSKEMNLSSEEIKSLEYKLNEIFKALNLSLIFHISKENEKPDSFGYRGWSEESQRLLSVQTDEKCNCLSCRLSRFEFSSVLTDISSSTIDETTSIQSDLELAYINYKIGNFKQSFRLFEEVANKSWQMGKYFSYYIAKHNIKNLYNLIKNYEGNLNKEEKSKILKESKNINFDKLLSQIPYLDKNGYELLKTIRDDTVLERASKEIDENFDKILEIFNQYKNEKGITMGTYYPQQIEVSLYKVFYFYINNCIIADAFIDFIKLYRKGVKAMLISFATSNRYEQKLKVFNKFFFDCAVTYGDAEEMKNTLENYQIDKLVFNDNELSQIIESANNFLNSFFEVSTFPLSKGETYPDDSTKSQIKNLFFEDKCRNQIKSLLIILSKVEFEKADSNELIKNLLNFIEHENFLQFNDIEFLNNFILNNHNLFTKEDIENLLESILNKFSIYTEGDLLKTISLIFKKNKFQFVRNRELIFLALSKSKENGGESEALVYLWSISNNEIKEELKQRIIISLNNNFNSELYKNAVLNNIIDYNQYFDQYLSEVNLIKNETNSGLFTNGAEKIKNYNFTNAMWFIYTIEIKNDDKRLEILTNLTDYMQFYINPENFDYTKFDIDWLYMIGESDVFYKRFAKIILLKKKIEEAIKEKFDDKLAKMYVKYFL